MTHDTDPHDTNSHDTSAHDPDLSDIAVAVTGTEAVTRNLGIVNEREQAALRAATVLVAGCGSVGGAVVEPLARLGVMRFRLADPDHFDVTNLNRQACVLADAGLPKPEVLARRVRAISPSAEVTVCPEGLTLENLDEALDGVHVAFDAIDPQMSAWVKYQLHERAARRGIPVVAGADFGGKPAVYVFDYRRRPVPFYGTATAEAHRESRVWDSVRWFGRTHFPSDYLPVMTDRLSNGGTWPQISYCVLGMGALGSRVVLDLLMNRRTRHVVTVDLHAATMPRAAALAHRARMPLELARTLRAVRTTSRKTSRAAAPASERIRANPTASTTPPGRPLPERLAIVLRGARLAPSAYNAQPWRFEPVDGRTVRLAPDSGRWPSAAPDVLGWAESLGCALGAMSYLAHGEWEARAADPGDADRYAGRFHCDRLRDDVLARQGALGLRSTHRDDLLRTPLDGTTLKRIELTCTERNLTLETVAGTTALGRLARGELDAAEDSRSDDGELWEWLRERARTEDGRRSFGDPGDLLGVSGAARAVGRVLGSRMAPPAMVTARLRARRLRNCGAVLVLRGPRRTVTDRLDAGVALMRVWLALTEAGYAAQPLGHEFGAPGAPWTGGGADRDDTVLAVLRAGRATTAPAHRATRCPTDASVRWTGWTG
ncbi:ThiF family adenylyltransferase [Streptomyces europaeiscabiei]|uniref:ThiF family adenylyltransferase n=1 Tax=Streptomyces europaeiscabiei TaxID=146819 RepID=A0ABU4NMY7_9ACTN|nr:ThiF family adenylyltransferase [Streptomyces europaeiscabiei]MDX3546753.1 ThiF family adenylyltransferase [Streptomyces europaeiscabiei]MDX3556447.1 ThiF family adenylyltransferase [Streptomyces europaeiscabiei]MDX3671326.1 ThiF family adenylyltransferase [Streptomyces europaeiscabiei]MDX3704062.1 ThiF family adenylyltransferase [Streptomyces europaeiscabiei]